LVTIALVAAGAAAATLIAPAMAQAQDVGARAVRVRYADLDLSQPADASRMLARLHHAAKEVCDDPGIRPLIFRAGERLCEKAALDHAVASLNAPMLSALYADTNQGRDRGVQLSSAR
jgi:UrcA family protein